MPTLSEYTEWNPLSSHDWAQRFGFVASRLFPANGSGVQAEGAVLRDGRATSFTLISSDGCDEHSSELSWSWSANTRYLIRIRTDEKRVVLRRWDHPQYSEPIDLAKVVERPEGLVALMSNPGPRKEEGAIDHVMQIFRSLRPDAGDSETAIRLLHRLLRPTVQFNDGVEYSGATKTSLLQLRERLQAGNPRLNLNLYPDLLLRHAAAELFQEAHVEADRQLYFFGMSPPSKIDKLPPEIRYTPAPLARILCELASGAQSTGNAQVRVLDPACGSGVFLTEMLGFAASEENSQLSLSGFDTSPVAIELAGSCLDLASSGGDGATDPILKVQDALTSNWGEVDVVVMNPPFRAYPDLETNEREAVADILGDLNIGRPDKALAFLWKAWESLSDGGVIAAVLPAALLGGDAGHAVRERIQSEGTVHVIGRFENHGFFKHSLIESGFVVIEKHASGSPSGQTNNVTAVVAAAGEEDQAVRTLRLLANGNRAAATKDVFHVSSGVLEGATWYPRRLDDYAAWTMALRQEFPKVSDLFDVKQGMRTGMKQAFLLTEEEFQLLPKREREGYFRPAAGQGTVRDGRLSATLYAFYPYDGAGSVIASEEELLRKVPKYSRRWLIPAKERLEMRKKIDAWYLPTWPRNWQYAEEIKLVSTYFGGKGSFALDSVGRHVVVDGHAWLLKEPVDSEVSDIIEDDEVDQPELQLLFAYVAILNSAPFHKLLKINSRNLQGGQLRLEPRYLNDIPLPDLRREQYASQILPELAQFGESIVADGLSSVRERLDSNIARIYGVS